MKNRYLRLSALLTAATLLLALTACGGQEPVSTSSEASSPSWVEGESPTAYPFYNPLTEPPQLELLPPAVPPDQTAVQKLTALSAQNKEAVGWLTMPGTTIDDAIVQGPDNKKYLRLDNYGNYSFPGCYFLDYRNTLTTREALGKNSIIYGHNLGNPTNIKDDPEGIQFAQLLKYADLNFASAHPYFIVNTPTEKMVFKIFTAFYSDTKFYYIRTDFEDSAQFMSLVNDARSRSEHIYDVDVGPTDRIMALSTCTYKYGSGWVNDNQRFVVMGRLLRVNELDTDPVTVTKNPSPKAPSF